MHKTRRLLGFAKRLLFSGARRSCSRRRVEKRKRVNEKRIIGGVRGTKPKIDVSTKRAAATFFGNFGEKLGAAQTAAAFVFYDISFVLRRIVSRGGDSARTLVLPSCLTELLDGLFRISWTLGDTFPTFGVSPAIFSSSSRRNVYRLLFVLVLMR